MRRLETDMCEELHDHFEDQVACARYRAERDALAQAVQAVCERMEGHCLGVEGMDDSPVASWARDLRAALGSLHAPVRDATASACDLTPDEDREAAEWVREHGGVDECERKTVASIEVGEGYTYLLIDLAEALGYGYEEIYEDGGVLDDDDAEEHLLETVKVKCYLADDNLNVYRTLIYVYNSRDLITKRQFGLQTGR